ncbi:hypothetical protein P12x_000038 [Tundrisphaera lichenicola]|uniref:hypothetical protein n=1 Tax=Tundrisphaera lichenicola TaxID=2029860 RepID=UPI003EB858C8
MKSGRLPILLILLVVRAIFLPPASASGIEPTSPIRSMSPVDPIRPSRLRFTPVAPPTSLRSRSDSLKWSGAGEQPRLARSPAELRPCPGSTRPPLSRLPSRETLPGQALRLLC